MTEAARTPLRILLTLAFLYYGGTKLLGAESAIQLYRDLGFGQWPRFVTGSLETLGALALCSPMQRLAALALIATMIVGFTSKALLVGPPVWHIAALGLGTALLLTLDSRATGRS